MSSTKTAEQGGQVILPPPNESESTSTALFQESQTVRHEVKIIAELQFL